MRRPLQLHALEARLAPAVVDSLPVLPDIAGELLANVRSIALSGRAAGLRPDVFAVLGDSNSYDPHFLEGLGRSVLPAAGPGGLTADDVATVGRYSAGVDAAGNSSFTRKGLAAVSGFTVNSLLATASAEVDAVRPSVAVVTIGTNDTALTPFDQFGPLLARLVDQLTSRGVVPILVTPPHLTYTAPHSDNQAHDYGQTVADVAEQKRVPLVNLRRATDGLPGFGLGSDRVHLNSSPNGGATFGAVDLLFGQNVRGLVTLQALTRVRQAAIDYDPDSSWAAPTGWTPLAAGQAVFAVGSDAGDPGEVAVYDTDTREELGRVRPFERSFLGGVKVAVADVTGDGVPDLVAAAGYGGGPLVVVYDGRTGAEASRFFAFESGQRGGVNIAAGDTDGDGRAEIVAGAAAGGGPRVRVFRADGSPTLDFFAFDADLRTGVTVAAVGDGIATGAGVGGGPVVNLFDGHTGQERAAAFVYDPSFRGGVTLAGGDLDGDGRPELVTAPGPGGSPHIRVFDPAALGERASFQALDAADPTTGTRVAVSGRRIVVATGPGRGLAVRTLDGADAGTQRFPEQFPLAATFVG